MTIIEQPSVHNFAGNIADIVIDSVTPVTFEIEDLFSEQYQPNSNGRITIPLRAFFEAHLSAAPIGTIPEGGQLLTAYNYSIDGRAVGTFYVLPGGVATSALDATVFQYSNFLTWQHQTRSVTYYEPQWLRYIAIVACRVKVRAYFSDSTNQTITIKELDGNRLYDIDCNYGRMRGRFEQQPIAYDVWTEAYDASRLSYEQRYVLQAEDNRGTSDIFVFENSLGGFDTIRFEGDKRSLTETESRKAVFDGVTNEYGIDYSQSWAKQTGYFLNERHRIWATEFINSSQRYHLASDSLRQIFVTKLKMESTGGVASSGEFTFAYSDQSKYLNLERSELPEVIRVPLQGDDLFFLELSPRLNEFPILDPTQDVLILAQYAFNKQWGTLSAASLLGNGSGGGNGIVGELRVRMPLRLDITPGATYISHDAPLSTDGKYNRYDNIDQWGHLTEDFHPHGGRKDVDMSARDVTVNRNIQSNPYASGVTGMGFRIDNKGNAEMWSLILHGFLETPELRHNKVTIVGGEQWMTDGGTIESVTPTCSLPLMHAGRPLMHDGKPLRFNIGAGWIVKFKLEEADTHTFDKDDILISKFLTPTGFATGFFRVTRKLSDRHLFITALNGFEPQVAMNVARQGNFTNTARQGSIYISGRDGYMRVLSGVNATEIKFENIRAQYGNMNGLVVNGKALSGYGMYGDNVYLTGTFRTVGGKTVDELVQEAADKAQADLNMLIGIIGDATLAGNIAKALAGETLVSGGFLKTDFIDVETLVTKLAKVENLVAKLAIIESLVAQAVSTQLGGAGAGVTIGRGVGSVSVYNNDGEVTANLNSGERTPYGWTHGGLFLSQKMYNNLRYNSQHLADGVHCNISNPSDYRNSHLGYESLTFKGNASDAARSHFGDRRLLFPSGGSIIAPGATTNLPGVLLAGKVLADGNKGYMWGHEKDSVTIRKVYANGVIAPGKYRIIHNLDHINYITTATAARRYNGWELTPTIISETTSYVEIWLLDNNVPKAAAFTFCIIGDN